MSLTNKRAERRHAFYKDQWGREYATIVETGTGDPCAPLTPMFEDPLKTPIKYLRVLPNRHEVVIEYGAWQDDLRRAHQNWHDLLREYARHHYGDDAGEKLENPTHSMLLFAGPKPLALEIIERVANGDRELLGLPPLPKEPEKAKGQPSQTT